MLLFVVVIVVTAVVANQNKGLVLPCIIKPVFVTRLLLLKKYFGEFIKHACFVGISIVITTDLIPNAKKYN